MAEYPGRDRVESSLSGRLVMAVPEAHKAYGIASAIRGLRVLTFTSGAPANALRQLGAEVRSVARSGQASTTFSLVDSPEGRAVLSEWAPAPVVVFRPDFKTRTLLEALECRMVAAEPQVARRLENKKVFRELCAAERLPIVETVECRWTSLADVLETVPRRFGDALVIQTARGHAGRRTWSCRAGQPSGLPDWLTGRPVLVSPLLDGATWTTNAVVLEDGVAVGMPMRQVTGEPRLGSSPMASCGVAFNPPGAQDVWPELRALTRSVGELARREGFVGFFGIDALGRPGRLTLIEMNARLTATLTAATLAELALGQTPLTVAHVLACLGESVSVGDVGEPSSSASGGHLIVREETSESWNSSVPATFYVESDELVSGGVQPGWPPGGAVTIWPAGSDVGGPEDERCRLLFSDQMLDGEGQFTPFVEGVLAAVIAKQE